MLNNGRTSGFPALPVILVLQSLICTSGWAQEPVHILTHDDLVICLSVSSDSKVIAVGCSNNQRTQIGSLVVWDAGTGMQIRKLKGYTFSTAGLEFTPDGRYLISA